MATGRRGKPRRVTGDSTTPNPIENTTNDSCRRQEISDYEQSREERIQENLQRMQKLGIIDLSLQLKSLKKPTPKPKKVFSPIDFSSAVPPSGPTRRSSRLQNVASVSYAEVELSKKDEKLEPMGYRPEVYTEEHEKLLGSTEMVWTLFVDGCGNDGKRIYDPVKGKTCHQCRQKTLGHRTHCSKCEMVQGQFCGDCLYMRYGEHVLEANQNPNWICPVCRGICNCSLCRQSKGWPATGSLYRKISGLGYKSVAHYLVQTRRAQPETEHGDNKPDDNLDVKDETTDNAVSPKLSFEEKDCPLAPESSSKPLTEPIVNTTEPPPPPPPGEDIYLEEGNESFQVTVDTTTADDNLDVKDETTDKAVSPKLSFEEKDCPLAPESSSKLPTEPIVNTTEPPPPPPTEEDICLEEGNESFQVTVDTTTADDTDEKGEEGRVSVERKKGTLGFRQKKKPAIFTCPGKAEEEGGGSKKCLSLSSKEEVVKSPEAKRKSSKMVMTEVSPDSVAGRLRHRRRMESKA